MVRAQAVDAENFLDSLEQTRLRNWRVENGRFRQKASSPFADCSRFYGILRP